MGSSPLGLPDYFPVHRDTIRFVETASGDSSKKIVRPHLEVLGQLADIRLG
jgi:hypothetical protein